MLKHRVLSWVLVLLGTGCAVANPPGVIIADAEPYPQVTLPNTHIRMLLAEVIAEDYKLSVWLPPSYTASSQRYPVIYVLDADLTFGIVTNMTDLLSFAGEIPEVIVVGIGYKENFMAGRSRDYSPTPQPDWLGSGGADEFLRFLKMELIPFVEATYRTKPNESSLYGYSLGGLFVLHTLFNMPELFEHYIAGSPYVGWDDRIIFASERAFSARQHFLPTTLVLTVGSEEDDFLPGYRSDVEALGKTLRARNYRDFNLKTHLLGGETHFSGTARVYVTGVKAAFANP